MLLAIVVLMPLPFDGEWSLDFGELAWLEFLVGIIVFLLGLWAFLSSVRSYPKAFQTPIPPTPSAPLIDEWIGEQGDNEESEFRRVLGGDERLLALVAGRGEKGLNRLAVTDRRVVVYSQGRIQSLVSYRYREIYKVEGKRSAVLTHLGDIILSTGEGVVSFKNVGAKTIDQVVALITRMKR